MSEVFKNYLGMCLVKTHCQYLGLPLAAGGIRKQFFRGLEEKMERKVNSWKNKMLSSTGKEVLIKSCLQPIPRYAMGCFKLSKTMCSNMTGLNQILVESG